jgi:hypothetical protein
MGIAPGNPTRTEPAQAGLEHDREDFQPDAHAWHPGTVEVLADKDSVPKAPERREPSENSRNDFGKDIPGVPAARAPLRDMHTLLGRDRATRRLYQPLPREYGQPACNTIAGMRKPIPDD